MPGSVGETDPGIDKDTRNDKQARQGKRFIVKASSKGEAKARGRPAATTGSSGDVGRAKQPLGNRQRLPPQSRLFATAATAMRRQFTAPLLRLGDYDSATQQNILSFVRSERASFLQGSPINAAAQTQHSVATMLREHPQVRADAEAVVAAETAAPQDLDEGCPTVRRSLLKLSVEGKSHVGLPQEVLKAVLTARVTTTQPWSRGSSSGKIARKILNVIIMKQLQQHEQASPEPMEEGEVTASEPTERPVDDAVLLRRSLQGSLCPADLSEDLVVEVPEQQADSLLRGRQSCVVVTSGGLRIHVDLVPDPSSQVIVSITGVGREVSGPLLLAKLAEIVVATGGDTQITLVATGSTVTPTAGIACEAEALADELGLRRKMTVSAPVLPRGIDKRCYQLTCTHRTAVLLPDALLWTLRRPDGSEVTDRVVIRRPRGCDRAFFSLRERLVASCTAVLPLPQPVLPPTQASGPPPGPSTTSSGSQQSQGPRDECPSPRGGHSPLQFAQATGSKRKDARAMAHTDGQQKPQSTARWQPTVSDENNRFSILKPTRVESDIGVSGPADVEGSASDASMPPPPPRSRSRGRTADKSRKQDRDSTRSKRSRAGSGGDTASTKRSCSASRSTSRARRTESPTSTTAQSDDHSGEVDPDTQLALDQSRAEEEARVALAAKEQLQIQQTLTRSAREAEGQASVRLSRSLQQLNSQSDVRQDSDQPESADHTRLQDVTSVDTTSTGSEVTASSSVQTPPSESPSTEGTQLLGPDLSNQ